MLESTDRRKIVMADTGYYTAVVYVVSVLTGYSAYCVIIRTCFEGQKWLGNVSAGHNAIL